MRVKGLGGFVSEEEIERLRRLPNDTEGLLRHELALIMLRELRFTHIQVKLSRMSDDLLAEVTEKDENVSGKAAEGKEQNALSRTVKRMSVLDALAQTEGLLSKLGEQKLRVLAARNSPDTPAQEGTVTEIVLPDNGRLLPEER